MNAAEVVFDQATETCEVCMVVGSFKIDEPNTFPLVCPECHVDWPE
jgi:hypothetical protein